MKFGLFDHVDRSGRAFASQLDERLEFVAAGDEAGFYGYHVAEHHATPLNMVPVPGVYLGAVAHATRRIRLGPLVYLLPLYSPLRLIEEICMLDHLSHGRLDVGVGRGVSSFELNFHKVDHDASREIFLDAYETVVYGLTHERLDHAGKYFSYENVPMELKPLQRPHPPFWYPSSNESGAGWAGAQGLSFSTLGSVEQAGRCIAAYKAGLASRNKPPAAANGFPGGTAIGVNRHIVVADTDEDAYRIAQPAYQLWYSNLTKLERDNVKGPRFTGSMFADVREAQLRGSVFIGSPETVRAAIERQVAAIGINYMILGFYFGSIEHADAMRSQRLFATEIMPQLAAL